MNNSPVKEHACPTREEKDVMHPGKWKLFALGQLVSLLYVTGGAFQSSLAWECDISAPLSTAGMLYLSLTVLLIPLCWTRTERAKYAQAPEVQSDTEANGEQCLRHTFLGLLPIQGDPWAYCGVGFLDFLGVFLYSRALHETTISNASFLFDIMTPATMVFSRCLLNRNYRPMHLMGVLSCIAGTTVVFVTDYQAYTDDNEGLQLDDDPYPDRIRGNVFALSAGIVLALNDVLGEVILDEVESDFEYLAVSSTCAALFAVPLAAIFEQEQIQDIFEFDSSDGSCSAGMRLGLVTGFVMSQFLSYLTSTWFLHVSDSAALSLSTLTENMWATGFSILVQGIVPSCSYFVAFAITIPGILLYHLAPSPEVDEEDHEDGDTTVCTDTESRSDDLTDSSSSCESLDDTDCCHFRDDNFV